MIGAATQTLSIVHLRHVLDDAPRRSVVVAGDTVASMLAALPGAPAPGTRVIVVHPDAAVPAWDLPPELWARTRVHPGMTLIVRPAAPAGGDDKNGLALLATIGVVIASAALGLGAAAWAASAGVVEVGGFGAAFVAAGVGGTVSVLAGAAMGNFFAPPKQTAPVPYSGGVAMGQRYETGELRNRADPWGVIPVVEGTVRMAGNLCGDHIVMTSGRETRVGVALYFCRGPARIDEIQIGSTPIEDLTGWELTVREGWDDDEPVTTWPGTPVSISVDRDLNKDDPVTVPLPACTEALATVTFPSGIYRLDKSGNPGFVKVTVQVRVRPVAGGEWVALSTTEFSPKTAANFDTAYFLANNTIPQGWNGTAYDYWHNYWFLKPLKARWAASTTWEVWEGDNAVSLQVFRCAMPDPSVAYELEIVRTSDVHDSQTYQDAAHLTRVQGLSPSPPVTRAGIAHLVLWYTIGADWNGLVDTLTVRVSAYKYCPDGAGAWDWRLDNNPAFQIASRFWSGNLKPVPLAEIAGVIHVERWRQFADWCNETPAGRSGPRFVRASIQDRQQTVIESIKASLASCRAGLTMEDGLYAPTWDRPRTDIEDVLTADNVWNVSTTYFQRELPDALRVQWTNPETLSTEETIVYNLSRSQATAVTFEVLTLEGITSHESAAAEGQYWFEVARWRTSETTLNTTAANLLWSTGALLSVALPQPVWSRVSSRIAGVTTDGNGAVTMISLADPVSMVEGESYSALVQLGGYNVVSVDLVTTPGSVRDLLPVTPIAPAVPGDPASIPGWDDIVIVGLRGAVAKRMIVKDIVFTDMDFNARVTLVPEAPEVHSPEEEPLRSFDVRTPGQDSAPADVVGLRLAEVVDFVSGTPRSRAVATWLPGTGPAPASYEVYTLDDRGRWRLAAPTADRQWERVVIPGEGITVAVVAVGRGGSKLPLSGSTPQASLTAAGDTTIPPTVEDLRVARAADGTRRISWSRDNFPSDVRQGGGVLLRTSLDAGADWTAMRPLHDGPLAASPYTYSPPTGRSVVAARLVDSSGNESETAAVIEIVMDDAQALVGLGHFEARSGSVWVGDLEGGWLHGGAYHADYAMDSIPDDMGAWPDTWDQVPGHDLTIQYTSPWIDVGLTTSFRPEVSVSATGAVTVEAAIARDIMMTDIPEDMGDWPELFDGLIQPPSWGPPATGRGRFYRLRVTVTGPWPILHAVSAQAAASVVIEWLDDVDTAGPDTPTFRRLGVGHFLASGGSVATVTGAGVVAFQGVASAGYSAVVTSKTASIDGTGAVEIRLYDSQGQAADCVIDLYIKGVANG